MTLPDSVSITGVTIPSDPKRPYTLGLSKPRKAGLLIDPYTGEIKGRSDRTPLLLGRLPSAPLAPGQHDAWGRRNLLGKGHRRDEYLALRPYPPHGAGDLVAEATQGFRGTTPHRTTAWALPSAL